MPKKLPDFQVVHGYLIDIPNGVLCSHCGLEFVMGKYRSIARKHVRNYMAKGLINVEEGEDENHNEDDYGVGMSSTNSVNSYRNYVLYYFRSFRQR